MKSLKLDLLIGIFFCSISLYSQSSETIEIYFDYELIPTGTVNVTGDTVYDAYFSIDTAFIGSFEKLTVTANDKEKIFSIKSDDIPSDPRFLLSGDKFLFNTGEWSGVLAWSVKGTKKDNKEIILKNKKEKVKHIVIEESKPRSLKTAKETNNPDEEE